MAALSIEQCMYTYSVEELVQLMDKELITIRQTNQSQVRHLKKYIFNNAKEKKIYLPPIVANTDAHLVQKPQYFRVIDGSKRVLALCQLAKDMKNNKHRTGEDFKNYIALSLLLKDAQIAVQMFSGLTSEECNQLFVDFNTKGKKVALSKRISYDSRNLLNVITNKLMTTNKDLQTAGVETEKRAVIKPTNKNLLSLSQLKQIVGIFIGIEINSHFEQRKTPYYLSEEEYIQLINEWLNCLFQLHDPETIGNYEHTILAGFPMLRAIAYYVNRRTNNKSLNARKKIVKERMARLLNIDWSIHHPKWQTFAGDFRGHKNYYHLSKDKKTLLKLVEWMEGG